MTKNIDHQVTNLLETIRDIETKLEDNFKGFELMVIPEVSKDAEGVTQADIDSIESYHQEFLLRLEDSDFSDEAKDAIAHKYDEFKSGVGESGSIACMQGLELGEASVDIVGFCMDQISGKNPFIGDGSHDTINIVLHEIGHTLHSKYYGGGDDNRFNAAQQEVFADSFSAYYMKHELGIENAYEMIAARRASDDHHEYPFHKHFEHLEQQMDMDRQAGVSLQDTMKNLADYVEHNDALRVPMPVPENSSFNVSEFSQCSLGNQGSTTSQGKDKAPTASCPAHTV